MKKKPFYLSNLKEMDVVKKAQESKHTDAVLLLLENKSKLAKDVTQIVGSIKDDKALLKVVWLVSEYVFNGCIEILSNDKKDE